MPVVKLLFFVFSFCVTSAHADSVYKINTKNSFLAKELSKYLNTKLSEDEVISQIKDHLKTQGYYTAKLNLQKNVIHIEKAVQWQFLFTGQSFFTKYYLKKLILENFSPSSLSSFQNEAIGRINTAYKAEGFHFITTKSHLIKTKSKFKKRIAFKIKEGNLIKVRKFKFSGEHTGFSNKKLKQLIKRYSGIPISNGFYSQTHLQNGLSSLKNDLVNLGFFKAEVILNGTYFKDKSVDLDIFVQTNRPTKVKSVNFSGSLTTSTAWLATLLGLSKGDQLNLYQLETGLELIEDYYLQRGFLRVQINKDDVLKYSKSLNKAEIDIFIQENEQVIVSDIQIYGNKKTKDYVVLNELSFKSGEVLTLDKIKKSVSNLQKLGLFSDLSITPFFKQKTKNGYPIKVSIKERKPGSFIAGFGLNTELRLTAKTFLGLSYKNLYGTARSIGGKLELKRNLREINFLENRLFITYKEPYLFSKDWTGLINISRNDEIWNHDSEKNETTLITSNRLDFILERELTNHTKLILSPFSLDFRKESELNKKFDEIREVINTIRPSLEIDYRDHPYLPTNGSFSRLQLEYSSSLFGSKTKFSDKGQNYEFDLNFIKFNASHTFYKRLNPRLIFAQSFRAGYLRNFVSNKSTEYFPFPKSRAFFLGGATTIRGFDPSRGNERIPSDTSLKSAIEGQTIGGGLLNIASSSHYYLTKSELRFPLSKQSSWWGAVFYDAGSVQIQSISPTLDPWRHSVGVGLRYNTPLGPLLNLELAYKLDRNTEFDESAVQVHLSVSSF